MEDNLLPEEAVDAAAADPNAEALFPIFPFRLPVSGLYLGPRPVFWWLRLRREELRLDVDGRYPQNTASGSVSLTIVSRVNWIASLTKAGTNHWTGGIWFKEPAGAAFPYTKVDIKAVNSFFPASRTATVVFSGPGVADRTVKFTFESAYFHPIEFEFDRAENLTAAKAVTSIQTHDHPNRPASLPSEDLTIDKVYQRTGFDVKTTGAASVIPMSIAAPGASAAWSDAEMHDAMQAYWSRFANSAQWSLWVLFASLHETGNSLGGVMFDDIGPNHRQGTSIFEDAFISTAPAGDANPVAWVRRMRFWTAVHEMGHAFNLAHSWQKALGPPTYPPPWLPGLANEPEARSFMNYPYNVGGGQSAFFSDFQFRFSDGELLFMRHAPAQWVQQGNADWFDHHGFQAPDTPGAGLQLVVRCNREKSAFDFLEPVTLEVKLTNTSTEPKIVPANALATDQLTIVIKKQGSAARQLAPFAQYCHQPHMRTLNPGESMYESLYASSGINGWDLADPGDYVVQVAAHLPGEQVVAAPMTLRMKPPHNFDEEHVAQDFFSEDVGRILAFDGSRYLESGNNTLREVCERMPTHRAAVHARVALGRSLGRAFKQLNLGDGRDPMRSAGDAGGKIVAAKANVEGARKELDGALFKKADAAAETLGHVDYNYYASEYAKWLEQNGDNAEAAEVCGHLRKTLSARNVLKSVIDSIPTPSAAPRSKKKSAKAGK